MKKTLIALSLLSLSFTSAEASCLSEAYSGDIRAFSACRSGERRADRAEEQRAEAIAEQRQLREEIEDSNDKLRRCLRLGGAYCY